MCFWNKEHADAAIAEAERVARETGTEVKAPTDRKNPFALPSVLTADPSSSLASRLVLHGRTINVARAVTRDTAGHLAEDNQRAREKGDKRNTYLMREGVIFPNSPAAAGLPLSEIEKRQGAFAARKTLLRSNPSLYISKTRLSVRQLPLFVTDRGLKRLAIHAVRAFNDEVKAGTREGLSRIEAEDDTLSPALEAQGKKKRGERETAVVQSKIVRQNEKIDPLTGRGRSKGYGFLELRSHRDALKVLRWANNNPAVGPLLWEWWSAELGDLRERAQKELKAVRDGKKGKEDEAELEARLKKLDARVAEGDERSGGGMRQGKTLMIEFSIENVQVSQPMLGPSSEGSGQGYLRDVENRSDTRLCAAEWRRSPAPAPSAATSLPAAATSPNARRPRTATTSATLSVPAATPSLHTATRRRARARTGGARTASGRRRRAARRTARRGRGEREARERLAGWRRWAAIWAA